MSVRAYDYAAAVLALEAEGKSPKDVTSGLIRTLQRRGHTRLAARVERTLLQLVERRERRAQVRLVIADAKDAKKHATAIARTRADLAVTETHETRVDTRLTGGFILETAELRHDASYRRALSTLYQKLTAV